MGGGNVDAEKRIRLLFFMHFRVQIEKKKESSKLKLMNLLMQILRFSMQMKSAFLIGHSTLYIPTYPRRSSFVREEQHANK